MIKADLISKGYSLFSFSDTEKLRQLYGTFSELLKEKQNPYAEWQGFYISTFDSESKMRQKVNEMVSNEINSFVQENFPGYKILNSNIILKEPGDKEVPLHQDWSFVDEEKYTSFEIWLPLNEVNEKNGGMYVLEESHKWFKNYRSSRVNTKCIDLYNSIKPHLKFINMKFGEGLVFDHRLMHYTPPNLTGNSRLVMQTAIIPNDAIPLFAYQDTDKDDIEIFKVNENFFLKENIFTRPNNYEIYTTIPKEKNEEVTLDIIRKKLRKKGLASFYYNELRK
jgi:hypothetical protein